MRPVTVQLFYKKSIRLAPYNQAEVGVIVTLEAGADEELEADALGAALGPAWAQIHAFVHSQEDAAIQRYAELNPHELPPPRPSGRAAFQPMAAEVTGDPPPRQMPADSGFPAREDAAPAAAAVVPAKTPEEAERRYFARYAADIGGDDMLAVEAFFGQETPPARPTTVDGWVELANRTRAAVKAAQEEAAHQQRVAAAKQTLAVAEEQAAPLGRAPARRAPRLTPQ